MRYAIEKRSLGLLVFAIASLLTVPKPATGAPANLLGMALPQAQQTDFFTFFHLNETSRQRDLARRVVVNFKPESEAFRKVVTVKATLDAQGKIVEMDLFLARSFVDGRVYAGDIVKSMLLDALPPSDREAVATLAAEIRRSEAPSGSPGYLAYLGKRNLFTQQLSLSSVRIENTTQDGEPWVLLQVALK
jgi:hypothetical protein